MIFFRQFQLSSLLFFILFTVANSLFAANIIVRVDRNPVNLKESFQITFTANDDADDEPDFSPLEKDFEILNQSQQQSVQIVNWEKTKSIQWILTVMAKHDGNLVIPAISFGQDSSQYSSITVLKAQVPSATKSEDLFLQVEVNTLTPYVQEQLIYTLKLYRKVNISQAALTEPELQDAVIEKLGEDTNYNTQYQGENYVVTERKYAIFPQKSGAMSIAPLTLTADIIIPGQRRSNSFFNRQNTRTQRAVSEAINLDVQAKPANTGSTWLPAKQVFLQEKWSESLAEVTVGQPITRTIRLTVQGQTASALPELYQKNMPDHLKAYPDQPVLQDDSNNTGMAAFREEKIALIPSQAGTYTLPAIEVPWWNTRTQKMEIAKIAEQTITAVVATGSTAALKPMPPIATPEALATDDNEQQDGGSSFQQINNLWFWLTLFFASAWILTLGYFLSRKSSKPNKPQAGVEKKSTVDKELKKACANNDPVMAKNALLQWGRDKFKQSSLSKIAACSDPQLQDEILSLNAVLYSDNAQVWQGADLWTAFQSNKSADIEKSELADPLQPLFKI